VRYLLCEKTDRLSHNFWDIATLDDLMNKQDPVIVLVKENSELSKESRSHEKFIFGIKALMAKNYIDNLSEEVKKGHAEKAAQGEYPSIAPIGYKNNLMTHRIEIDENEAPAVRRLYELYTTSRYSLEHLRQVAKDAGLFGRRAKRQLSKSEVERILKNPIYYGMFRWRGKIWPGIHTPIISKELFDQMQEVFASQNRAKTHRHRFAFGNVLRCSRCGCWITNENWRGSSISDISP
jgi:DNA invertase Pin-like site-specific DNA recombinase